MTEVTKEQMDDAREILGWAHDERQLENLKLLIAIGDRIASGDWVLVPKEATEAMIEAWSKSRPANNVFTEENCAKATWSDMISAVEK